MEFQEIVKKFEEDLTTKYLYYEFFNGALFHGMRTMKISSLKLNNELIDAFKYAVCNVYFGGFDPEFDTEESFKKWENFNIDAYIFITENELKKFIFENQTFRRYSRIEDVILHDDEDSPFRNKTIPYPLLVDKNYGKARFTKEAITNWRTKNTAVKYGL